MLESKLIFPYIHRMRSRLSIVWGILALLIAVEAIIFLARDQAAPSPLAADTSAASTDQAANVEVSLASSTDSSGAADSSTASPSASASNALKSAPDSSAVVAADKPPARDASTTPISSNTQAPQTNAVQGQAVRIQNPYSTPPRSLEAINDSVRSVLVNIFCSSNGAIRPISGSGVIIDPRGVILTNAHVAQYVLLAASPSINLSCTVRTGSPAHPAWKADVLYIPEIWVASHAHEISAGQAVIGTGEHDYALLFIGASVDGTALTESFSYLPIDSREAIGFLGDEVLVAGYPAEFLGGLAAESNLYAASSATTIKRLLTFGSGSVDLLSLGGVIEAQSGSSGGAVANPWGKLIGLITTTSSGVTTAERDLHALSLSYIARDFAVQKGQSLEAFLSGNVLEKTIAFNATQTPGLLKLYFDHLKQSQN